MGAEHVYTQVEEKDRSTCSDDDSVELPQFLQRRRSWRHFFQQPLIVAIIAAFASLFIFGSGFSLGKSEYSSLVTTTKPSVSVANTCPTTVPAKQGLHVDVSPAHQNARPKHPSAEPDGDYTDDLETPHDLDEILDLLRAQPAVDLEAEYGLDPEKMKLYPEPLRERIAIVNVDTREWKPWDTPVKNMQPNHWGYFNHYIYAQMHGYTFIHSQVPETEKHPDEKDENADKGLHNTWAKVNEQFRLTMQDQYQFVVVLDADTIFTDMRVPLEALLGHWNVTKDIALAGGRDLDYQLDQNGRVLLNTGFIITQNTPVFPAMMRDWANCPTDIKYPNCSLWKNEWAHEQSALSNFVRYDYDDSIREMDVEEVHLGKFITHYWGGEKVHLKEAGFRAILGNTLDKSVARLSRTWLKHHQRVWPAMYQDLLTPPVTSTTSTTTASDASNTASDKTATTSTESATKAEVTETTTATKAEDAAAETPTETKKDRAV